jgi:hypothetical protein
MFGYPSASPGMKSKITCRNTTSSVVLAYLKVHLHTRNQIPGRLVELLYVSIGLEADVVSSTMLEQYDETFANERVKALAQLARKTGFE